MQDTILNREQVREVDRTAIEDLGMSGLVLMENAGRGCVDVLRKLGATGPVLIAAGKGNNGGDGFVVARHLDSTRIAAEVALLCPPGELKGDAAANFQLLAATDVKVFTIDEDRFEDRLNESLANAQWIVDALLGTGATGPPRAPYDAVIEQLNAASARKLAIDIPSGLDCDTGKPEQPTFRADRTCTFVAAKPGLLAAEAGAFVGIMHVIDIGVPRSILQQVQSARHE